MVFLRDTDSDFRYRFYTLPAYLVGLPAARFFVTDVQHFRNKPSLKLPPEPQFRREQIGRSGCSIARVRFVARSSLRAESQQKPDEDEPNPHFSASGKRYASNPCTTVPPPRRGNSTSGWCQNSPDWILKWEASKSPHCHRQTVCILTQFQGLHTVAESV